jgi:hypothetical protein
MRLGEFGRVDRIIMITFLVGVVGIVYLITSLFLMGFDENITGLPESYLSWMMTERFVMIGMIFVILIIMTYVLMEQKNLEESHAAEQRKAPAPQSGEKNLKEDIMRYYRDIGALKIVLKDGVMDTKTYNERKKYLEDMVKTRKRQLEKLRGGKASKK